VAEAQGQFGKPGKGMSTVGSRNQRTGVGQQSEKTKHVL
jgi:hypothetical protein